MRIGAVVRRYLLLHKRSLPRAFEIVFWPVMELLVWGYVSVYLRSLSPDTLSNVVHILISAMIFWDILYRSQQAVSISVIEDIWTQNIVNVLISPLRMWEWMVATFLYGLGKTLLITAVLWGIALALYQHDMIESLGFALIPLAANLFLFGWALGVFTSALVIRWGHAAEALIWGIPFLIQPLSAIFYPVSTLPGWLQPVARCLPSTHIFEGMRAVLQTGSLPAGFFWAALGLNLLYFVLAAFFFQALYRGARESGRLGRLGMD